MDERQLRLGSVLSRALQSHLEQADVVLVVGSQRSCESPWVGHELQHALAHRKLIVPVLIEPVQTHDRFREHLGIVATSRLRFADAVHVLLTDLSHAWGAPLGERDPKRLTELVQEIAEQDAELRPLVAGVLGGEGLHGESMEFVFAAEFHALDFTLNALFDLQPSSMTGSHLAYGFRRAGAGLRALRRWVQSSGDGDLPLTTALGESLSSSEQIDAAIELLRACKPPNNMALYTFIGSNAAIMNDVQRGHVIHLVTWPTRGPERFGDVLGRVACNHFPDSDELRLMWSRWIQAGDFDRYDPSGPKNLAHFLAEVDPKALAGAPDLIDVLRSHVRRLARSGDRAKVEAAIAHLRACADAGTAAFQPVLRELEGVSATAEWDEWRKRDHRAAMEMEWYVSAFIAAAAADRDWTAALERYEQKVAGQ